MVPNNVLCDVVAIGFQQVNAYPVANNGIACNIIAI